MEQDLRQIIKKPLDMDYSKMDILELDKLIVAECLKQGITEPKEQMQYIKQVNKPLADAFIDKNKRAR